MSFMDELKKWTRPYDDDSAMMDDDMDLGGGLDDSAFTRPVESAPNPAAAQAEAPINMGGMGAAGVAGAAMGAMGGPGGTGDSAGMGAAAINMGMGSDLSKYRVVLVKPEAFDSATLIAKLICQGDTVILNCEETNQDVARRIVDFLSGCAFALGGSIKKAANKVIIIAPHDVGVDDAEDGDREG